MMGTDVSSRRPRSSKSDTRKLREKRPGGQALRKGKACIRCRHSKIKCDGVKPACGPCVEGTKDADCQYTDPPSRAIRLQKDIEELLARIEVLETSNGTSKKTILAQVPFANSPSSTTLSLGFDSLESFHSNDPKQTAFSLDDHYSSSNSEPPISERATLIDHFINRCSTLAFFLNPHDFRRSALLLLPLGDIQRPSPALLACVYLWGLRISSSPSSSAEESAFLRRARRYIALEVGTQKRTQIMQVIQAKILLIIYLVNIGQFLEAEFHANGAVSLVLSYGLHMMTPTLNGVYDDPEGRLPRCTGPADQAERIKMFWMVFFIQRMLAVMVGSPSNSFGSLDSYLEIRTPLPLDTTNYGPEDIARTLYDFLHDTSSQRPETSCLAIYSKSAILFHRAVYLHKQISLGRSRDELIEECARFERVVLNFYSSLPAMSHIKERESSFPHSPPFIPSEKLALMSGMVLCACVNINSIFSILGVPGARKRLLEAAENLFISLESSYPGSHPLTGTLGRLTCEALIVELHKIKSDIVWAGDGLDMAHKVEEETAFERAVTDGMGAMEVLVTCCPLVGYDLQKVKRLYSRIGRSMQ